jgi:hypothetical protein
MKSNRRATKLVLELVWLFTEALGYTGILLIGYSVYAIHTEPWPPLERVAGFVSALLTLIGTIVTAAGIYAPGPGIHPPWWHTRVFVSPAIIAGCFIALYVLVHSGKLPPVVVSGFGLLAISGGLKRIFPGPRAPEVSPEVSN